MVFQWAGVANYAVGYNIQVINLDINDHKTYLQFREMDLTQKCSQKFLSTECMYNEKFIVR